MKLAQMLGIDTSTPTQSAPAGGQGTNTKVAQANAGSDIDSLVRAALQAGGAEKNASAADGDVQGGITKMAADLLRVDSEAEKRASYEHGRLMGAGFIDEVTAHAKAASEINGQGEQQKIAAEQAYEQALVEKLAAEHPADFERVVQQGYNDTWGALQKHAQDNAEQGYRDTINAAHKTAMDHFAEGFNSFMGAVKEAQAQQGQAR